MSVPENLVDGPRRIMMITNCEYGQANVHLAVLHELVVQGGLDIYFTSFDELAPRVAQVVQRARKTAANPSLVTHRVIKGESMLKTQVKKTGGAFKTRKPGFIGAWKAIGELDQVLMPWDPETAIQIIHEIAKIIDEVEPDLIVCDPAFLLAREACRLRDRKYIILSPGTVREHVAHAQGAKALWQWGGVGTAWPYPLPWYLIPLAILFSFRTIWVFIRFGKLSPFAKKRKEAGFTTSLALFETDSPLVLKEYFMSTPELDWPAVIPDKYCAVGPILQAVESVGDEDPELATWLAQRPTVLIVLGSVYKTKGEFAAEMIQAICRILSTRSDIQILWKLQSLRVGPKDVQQALKGLVAEDQVRVVEWLEADPLAILQTGNVCCSVNHGGSNSYHEAMATGTPQVLMPAWYDCYDFAARVRWFKNGAWGNPKGSYADGIIAQEFADAVLQVIGKTPDDEGALEMKERCARYAKIAKAQGGRERVAREIVELAQRNERE